jgi:hypothetical protein
LAPAARAWSVPYSHTAPPEIAEVPPKRSAFSTTSTFSPAAAVAAAAKPRRRCRAPGRSCVLLHESPWLQISSGVTPMKAPRWPSWAKAISGPVWIGSPTAGRGGSGVISGE